MFKHHTTTEIVLNYLTQEKMYREIGEILVDRLPKYFKSVSVDNDIIDSENNKKMKKISHIPFTHMEIYTNALLKMVRKRLIEKDDLNISVLIFSYCGFINE